MKRIAIVNSHSPFGDNAGKDALDLALILGSYEQDISVFFHDDGVFQLVANQQPECINQKNYLKTFAAFELYDIENVYVCQRSLNERNLTPELNIKNISTLPQNTFNSVLAEHDVIIRF